MHYETRCGDLLKVIWHDGQWRVPVHEAAGAGPFHLAEPGGRRGDDLIRAARLLAVRHRLEAPTGDVAVDIGRVILLACGWRWM
jgi:hypothetical protein